MSGSRQEQLDAPCCCCCAFERGDRRGIEQLARAGELGLQTATSPPSCSGLRTFTPATRIPHNLDMRTSLWLSARLGLWLAAAAASTELARAQQGGYTSPSAGGGSSLTVRRSEDHSQVALGRPSSRGVASCGLPCPAWPEAVLIGDLEWASAHCPHLLVSSLGGRGGVVGGSCGLPGWTKLELGVSHLSHRLGCGVHDLRAAARLATCNSGAVATACARRSRLAFTARPNSFIDLIPPIPFRSSPARILQVWASRSTSSFLAHRTRPSWPTRVPTEASKTGRCPATRPAPWPHRTPALTLIALAACSIEACSSAPSAARFQSTTARASVTRPTSAMVAACVRWASTLHPHPCRD
jgi:hypothetical protein